MRKAARRAWQRVTSARSSFASLSWAGLKPLRQNCRSGRCKTCTNWLANWKLTCETARGGRRALARQAPSSRRAPRAPVSTQVARYCTQTRQKFAYKYTPCILFQLPMRSPHAPAPPVDSGISGSGLRTAPSVPPSTGSARPPTNLTWGFQMNSGQDENRPSRRGTTEHTRCGSPTGNSQQRSSNRRHEKRNPSQPQGHGGRLRIA